MPPARLPRDQGEGRPLTRLEMGRRLGDRKSLEESIRVFAELGAELDLATARQRLQEIAPHGGG